MLPCTYVLLSQLILLKLTRKGFLRSLVDLIQQDSRSEEEKQGMGRKLGTGVVSALPCRICTPGLHFPCTARRGEALFVISSDVSFLREYHHFALLCVLSFLSTEIIY
jgi:hypothetical protein